jgi:hypothetical protein
VLHSISASLAVTFLIVTSTRLSANANPVADLDSCWYILANSNSLADDLVADYDRIVCLTPA